MHVSVVAAVSGNAVSGNAAAGNAAAIATVAEIGGPARVTELAGVNGLADATPAD
jgi:hypothetical protein